MSVLALTDAFVHVHGYDFTSDSNALRLAMEAAALDKTTFGSAGWREITGGAKSHTLDVDGFWQSATSAAVDPESFPDLGVVDRVVTLGTVQAEGEPAYMLQAGKFAYSMFGPYGELAPFTLGCAGTNGVGVVRGTLAKERANVSSTGALGSGLLLGAVGASQFLYGTVHLFTAGTTVTIVLESDDNAGFTSATTRATIGPLTTTGGTWVPRVAGAITDTYFRYRVSAITGTFNIAAAIGVQ